MYLYIQDPLHKKRNIFIFKLPCFSERKGKIKRNRDIGERLIKYSISSFVRLIDIPSLNMQRYTICLTESIVKKLYTYTYLEQRIEN